MTDGQQDLKEGRQAGLPGIRGSRQVGSRRGRNPGRKKVLERWARFRGQSGSENLGNRDLNRSGD